MRYASILPHYLTLPTLDSVKKGGGKMDKSRLTWDGNVFDWEAVIGCDVMSQVQGAKSILVMACESRRRG